MSKYNKTILTNAGLDLAAKASSGKTKFTITRAATSTEKLADKSISELQKLTALPSLMQYGEINNVADSAQDKSIVIGAELIFNNKDLSTGYNINTIGLFAKEEATNKEILYALTTAVEPEMMPDFKDKILFKFNLTMFVVVGQTDNVTVNVTQNGVVTQEQLAKTVQALPQKQDIININNQIKALGKVKKVQGKEPDSEGNVNITFGKIIKGWDMVNNTYDPSQTKNNDTISNIWPVDQMVIAQVVARLFSSEKSLKSEIAKKDNTADVDNKLRNKIKAADLIGYISDHNGNHLAETTGDANAISEPGIYFTKGGIKNLPLNNWGILQVIGITATSSDISHRKVQIYYPDKLNQMPYYRNLTDTTFSAWHQLASTDDITNLVNRINTLGKVQKVNNQWPGLDGNVNINTLDNPTVLANGTSLNSIVKPGFYLANNCKDGPIASYNEVFCVVGAYHADAILTQFLPIGYYVSSDYSQNYTDLILRTVYIDSNLNPHWGFFRKIPTIYA